MSERNPAASPPLRIVDVRSLVFRALLVDPIRTSYGMIYNRPRLLVRGEDENRVFGWGEVWCNLPAVGVEHRAHLLDNLEKYN